MARTDTLNNFLTDVAESIRTKKGTTEPIQASAFDTEIESIETSSAVLGTKTITTNGTYNATDDNLDGYSEVEVATSGVDINDYFYTTPPSNNSTLNKLIKKIPLIDTSGYTSMRSMFYNYNSLTTIPQLDTSKVTNMEETFSSCSSLTTIPQLDTSEVTNMAGMFKSCKNLAEIPLLDTRKVTNMGVMFYECSSLTTIPQLDTSEVTEMVSMLGSCSSLTTIPQLDTSKVTSMWGMFQGCSSLTTIPQLDTSNVINIDYMLHICYALTTLGGFKDLGKAYLTTQSANYSNYKLNLSTCSKLTHESLINVINNLYDITSKGVQPQQLVLGSTNLAKLTAEEIGIAQAKGWSVS